jgi:hypothetical protein
MTDSPIETVELPDDDQVLAAADDFEASLPPEAQGFGDIPASEGIPDIPLTRCDLHFIINLKDVSSLAEALDTAAISLGRYGMNDFYVLATNPDTGDQWIVQNGIATDAAEEIARLEGGEDVDES